MSEDSEEAQKNRAVRIQASVDAVLSGEVTNESPRAQLDAAAAQAKAEATPTFIQYEEFAKVKMVLGRVLNAERVPKTDKLIQLTVDVGESTPRTIVAGIGLSFAPEHLMNREVIVVANLEPRKLRGIMSHGMILAAGPSPDKLELACVSSVSGVTLPRGTEIG